MLCYYAQGEKMHLKSHEATQPCYFLALLLSRTDKFSIIFMKTKIWYTREVLGRCLWMNFVYNQYSWGVITTKTWRLIYDIWIGICSSHWRQKTILFWYKGQTHITLPNKRTFTWKRF